MSFRVFTKQEWALCFVTMLWGASFLIIRLAMQACGPMYFVGLRFGCASLVLLLVSRSLLREMTLREVVAGCTLGVIVFLGFGLQTMGLVTIPAAKSAFITAFYVPLVPLLELVFLRHKLSPYVWAGLTLAFPGVLLISWPENAAFGLGAGEIATVICALVFAVEIVLLSVLAPGCDTRRMVTVEVLVTSLLGFACMPLLGEQCVRLPVWVMASVVGLGLATACIQSILTWAQKSVPPSRATLIYTGEPVWAGIFGALCGEQLGVPALTGCVLIIAGILVSNR